MPVFVRENRQTLSGLNSALEQLATGKEAENDNAESHQDSPESISIANECSDFSQFVHPLSFVRSRSDRGFVRESLAARHVGQAWGPRPSLVH